MTSPQFFLFEDEEDVLRKNDFWQRVESFSVVVFQLTSMMAHWFESDVNITVYWIWNTTAWVPGFYQGRYH